MHEQLREVRRAAPTETRQFGPDGGDDQVVIYQFFDDDNQIEVECEITEPEDGDAEATTIVPQTVTYTDYSNVLSTVTNTFPAPSPDPSPSPEPSPSPTEDVDDTVDEAEPAEPVETEPDFTG
ncbi:MAG: hypothetical protein U5L04_11435 [Trueperaceae bacterium]|nr:hypothetical protein [Trueperaceae bacterium]